MKIIGIIPSRYKSSRFEGKPLADILGRPMVWWVYQQAIKVKELDEVIVATDDERIFDVCKKYDMNAIMTSVNNETPTDRIYEVSNRIKADYYISINGDEPLIKPEIIEAIIPENKKKECYVANIMTTISDPVQAMDPTNLKIVTNENGDGVYISRAPIPFPKGSMEFKYKKHVGVYAFDKEALDMYHNTERGQLERIEDIDLLRYIEHGVPINFIDKDCDTLSVDTKKDLEKIVNYLKQKGIKIYE